MYGNLLDPVARPQGFEERCGIKSLKDDIVVSMITIDDFKKVDLRVGKVLAAIRVEGSEKLLKLQVDVGEEKRQIVAGIGLAYEPETLVGREIIIVANLEPRLLMGIESHGMLLAASSDNPVLLMLEKEVAPGCVIR